MGVFVCILNILLQYTTAMDRNELLLSALKSAFLAFGCFADFWRVVGSAVSAICCFADSSDAAGSAVVGFRRFC